MRGGFAQCCSAVSSRIFIGPEAYGCGGAFKDTLLVWRGRRAGQRGAGHRYCSAGRGGCSFAQRGWRLARSPGVCLAAGGTSYWLGGAAHSVLPARAA